MSIEKIDGQYIASGNYNGQYFKAVGISVMDALAWLFSEIAVARSVKAWK